MPDLFTRILTVSELTSQIRVQLEARFPLLWVEGELSNVRCAPSRHWYLTLRDRTSQIRAVMFRMQAERLKFSLVDGLEVIACGRLSVYEPRGDYQLLLDLVEPKGIGERQLAFLQLKATLAQEGLFDSQKKKPLPRFPQRIGLVTSPAGAAIHDLVTVLQRRWPLANLVLLPVAVQGQESVPQIIQAIHALNVHQHVDLIIIGRGGGSMEDLWVFNEALVVRAIAGSRIPVISAVGHETDFTLADFAADCRAPTPSAAAELAVPDWMDVQRRVSHLQHRLVRTIQASLTKGFLRVQRVEGRLPEPRWLIRRCSQRVDELQSQLVDRLLRWYRALERRIVACQILLREHNPRVVIVRRKGRISTIQETHHDAITQRIWQQRSQVQSLVAQLHQLSPLAVLSRGYSLVQREWDEKILKDSRDVTQGEQVRVTLQHGRLTCRVERIHPL